MPKIEINNFVRRQTKESKYSYFDGNFAELVEMADDFFEEALPSGRPGVMLIPVPVEKFYCGVVNVTPKTRLKASFSARRDGEACFIQTEAIRAKKLPAMHVDLVIYSHETLGIDSSTDADWEIVSINARPTIEEEPPTPMAMARNFLELVGGTKAEYSAEDFAKSILYWSTRAMCG